VLRRACLICKVICCMSLSIELTTFQDAMHRMNNSSEKYWQAVCTCVGKRVVTHRDFPVDTIVGLSFMRRVQWSVMGETTTIACRVSTVCGIVIVIVCGWISWATKQPVRLMSMGTAVKLRWQSHLAKRCQTPKIIVAEGHIYQKHITVAKHFLIYRLF